MELETLSMAGMWIATAINACSVFSSFRARRTWEKLTRCHISNDDAMEIAFMARAVHLKGRNDLKYDLVAKLQKLDDKVKTVEAM